MVDFTECPRDGLVYGGSDKKFGIIYNNEHYMIKFSDEIPDFKRNSNNSSYSNNVLSEYICCNIYKSIGILFNPTTKDAKIAPVFDCGSCLYPQLTDEAIENILNKQDEIQLTYA